MPFGSPVVPEVVSRSEPSRSGSGRHRRRRADSVGEGGDLGGGEDPRRGPREIARRRPRPRRPARLGAAARRRRWRSAGIDSGAMGSRRWPPVSAAIQTSAAAMPPGSDSAIGPRLVAQRAAQRPHRAREGGVGHDPPRLQLDQEVRLGAQRLPAGERGVQRRGVSKPSSSRLLLRPAILQMSAHALIHHARIEIVLELQQIVRGVDQHEGVMLLD